MHLKHLQLIHRSGSIDDRSPWAAVGGTVPGGGSRRMGTAAREAAGVDVPRGGVGVAAAFKSGVAAAVGFPAVGGVAAVAAAAAAVAAGEAVEAAEYCGWSLVAQWPKRCDSRATPFFLCRSGALQGEKGHGGEGVRTRGEGMRCLGSGCGGGWAGRGAGAQASLGRGNR